MRPALALAVLALAGCANVDTLRQQARYQSDYAVCEKTVTGMGPIRGVAYEEAQRRQLDCGQYMAGIQAGRQADQQGITNGILLLQAAQPKPIAAPIPVAPSTICTTRPSLGGATTVCQ